MDAEGEADPAAGSAETGPGTGEIQDDSRWPGGLPGSIPPGAPFPEEESEAVLAMMNAPIPATPTADMALIRTYAREILFGALKRDNS
ncbi:hypothetical protein GCM10010156_02290 [Planobispora rosea]|uniref:Uncharacterized protein n=1 Tax=Planobispora rosea TaxID=35762 RepID=A0A8J3S242_PLARO|nr:hypothetical protein GCM10010156_02290 [Planobispora rosea]GIH82258.1 hypothetical protein Pro02_06660 [Planobispora rosea]